MIMQSTAALLAIMEQTRPEYWVSQLKPQNFTEKPIDVQISVPNMVLYNIRHQVNITEPVNVDIAIPQMVIKNIRTSLTITEKPVSISTNVSGMSLINVRTSLSIPEQPAETNISVGTVILNSDYNRGYVTPDVSKEKANTSIAITAMGLTQIN